MHELFEILDTIPNWQTRFDTLRQAADYAKCLPEYYDYMHSDEGRLRALRFHNVPDTVAANKAERLMRERMSNLASRANPRQQEEFDAKEDDDYDNG